MNPKALIIPIAVVVAGAGLMAVGIVHAEAAVTVPCAVPHHPTACSSPSPVARSSPRAAPALVIASPSVAPPRSSVAVASPSASAPMSTLKPAAAPSAAAGENCTSGAALVAGKYWISNNQWGKDSGSGSQCISRRGGSGTLRWATHWQWTGQRNSVKSYASAVLGWHWGFKATGTGLPIALGDHKAVRTTWNFTVTQQKTNTLDVSYDLWLHDIAKPDWTNQPTDEVMVWLYRSGGAGPLGTKQATVSLGGTTWDLYRGTIGWNVFSFVRTGNTTSSAINLTDFTDDLIRRGWLQRTKYLSSVEAGTEIFTGTGRLDTTAYAVTID